RGTSIWFAPLASAEAGGTLRIESNDPVEPSAAIAVDGIGIVVDQLTDRFVQGSPTTLDVLATVGDVSEADEATADDAIAAYTDTLSEAGVDYHLSIMDAYGCPAGDGAVDPTMGENDRADAIAKAVNLVDHGPYANDAMLHAYY